MHCTDGKEDLSLSEVLELVRAFEEHGPRLLAMLRVRIDPALEARLGAEAILQETFLTARRRWARRPDPDKMSSYAWLLWLARQCLFDAWRRDVPGLRDLLARSVRHPDGPWAARRWGRRRVRPPGASRSRSWSGGRSSDSSRSTARSSNLSTSTKSALEKPRRSSGSRRTPRMCATAGR